MTRVCSALVLIPLLALTACGPAPVRGTRAWHGATPISATYQFGRLTADLPPGSRVEPVTIAARHTLERQGHTIQSAEVTPQQGKIVALAPANIGYDKITMRTAFEGQGTVIRLDIWPPNESRARVALETLLQTLGL
tara:strand:+ start:2228 stop:2638 length:411 start_codon:yes stop_codon:yes gene_type:complete